MTNSILKLYDIRRCGTRALGPGLRYAIWVQGCPFRCDGCTTPESRPLDGGWLADVNAIAKDIIEKPEITGITISGGEPFLQAESLACLLYLVKAERPELDVIVFTGFLIDALTSESAKKFLSYIDLLIDGPFIKELNNNVGLRGSTNQRFNFLTDRLKPHKTELETGMRTLEFYSKNDLLIEIGIPLTKQ